MSENIEPISSNKAAHVKVDTAPFSKNLSGADNNVQHALETLDQMSGGGGSNGYFPMGW